MKRVTKLIWFLCTLVVLLWQLYILYPDNIDKILWDINPLAYVLMTVLDFMLLTVIMFAVYMAYVQFHSKEQKA